MCPGQSVIPPDVSLDNGITEDEAVHIALWNNAALLELLADLGISRAQLLNANLISDPQFIVFFPLGPKQLEFMGTNRSTPSGCGLSAAVSRHGI